TVSPRTPTGSSRRRSSQMPTGKRASMREGPLAALFRKTAEESGGNAPETEGERSREAKDQPQREELSERAAVERAEAAGGPDATARASLPEDEPPHVPSPQERLRQAFSSDIPRNVL